MKTHLDRYYKNFILSSQTILKHESWLHLNSFQYPDYCITKHSNKKILLDATSFELCEFLKHLYKQY